MGRWGGGARRWRGRVGPGGLGRWAVEVLVATMSDKQAGEEVQRESCTQLASKASAVNYSHQ